MKVNYSEIKNNFWKYLEKLQDPNIDLTAVDTLSIFSFSDKLKDFLSSEYNFDESIFAYNLEDVLAMPVEDGQFTEEVAETPELPEVPETPESDPENPTGATEGTEETDGTEQTEETEQGEQTEETDEENNFFKEYLNEFLQNEDVKNAIDADKNGELSDEEIDNFFKQIAGNDGNADDISLTDIQNAYEKIKDGSFVLGEAGAGTESAEETTTPETTPTDTTTETQDTTPTAPVNPGNNTGGGGYTPKNNGGDQPKADDKVSYKNMSLSELQTKKSEKQAEIDKSREAINDVYSGRNKAVSEAQTTADEQKKLYETAVSEDKKLTEEQKKAITDNETAIADKKTEVSAAQQLSNETQGKINKTDNEIKDLDSTLTALNESKTKLESQKDDDPEKQAEINSKLEAVKAKITEVTQQKTDKEAEKKQLETDKQAYDDIATEKQGELDKLKEARATLTADASDETKTALENYEKAEAAVETTRASELKTAEANLKTLETDFDELNVALREKQAAETKKEYKAGTPDLFTEAGFEVQKVTRNGMDYIVIGPKDADPNEELPVMVYLHGSGEKGNNLSKIEGASFMNMLYKHPEEFGQTFNGYIIMPQTPDYWDRENRSQEVRQIVNEFGQTHAIDRDNIVIAGHSMGGIGALYMAGTNDDHFYSRALVLSGYNPGDKVLKNINIPVMGFGESGNGTKGLIQNAPEYQYYDSTAGHGAVPRDAFGRDSNGNGKSDVFEWLFPDYAD